LHRAIRKYGEEAFIIRVLRAGVPEAEIVAAEVYFIKKHNTHGRCGYNMTAGGDGTLGCRPNKQSRKKMSAAQKLRFENKFERDRIALMNVGKKQTEAVVSKRVKSTKIYYEANPAAAEARRAQLRRAAPKTHTKETLRKLSLAHLGKSWTAKQRAAREDPDSVEKARVSIQKYWAKPGTREKAAEIRMCIWAAKSAKERKAVGERAWVTRRANSLKKVA
jgi:hypothetical protein